MNQAGKGNHVVGIELTERGPDYFAKSSSGTMECHRSFLDYFVRSSPGKLLQCKFPRGSQTPEDPNLFHSTMKISLDHTPFVPSDQQQQFTVILPSLNSAGFVLSEKYPEYSPAFRPEGWEITMDLSHSSVAAVMFRSENKEAFAVVLTAKQFGVGVDVFLPEGTERLTDIIGKISVYLRHGAITDRSSSELQVRNSVCATTRTRFMNDEIVYYVDIRVSETQPEPMFLRRIHPRHLRPRLQRFPAFTM